MPPLSVEDTYRLSPMQQGILYHYRICPESRVYVQPIVVSLREHLDPDALRRAWKELMHRHSALRTSFRWQGLDEPLQVVYSDVPLDIDEYDWRNLLAETKERQFEDYLTSNWDKGFDLSKPPLTRLALFRFGESEYRLVWTYHHIIGDGHSCFVILKEVFSLYEACLNGHEIQYGSSRPYRDYIDWLYERDHSKSESYWRELLKGFTSPTTANPLPNHHGSPGRRYAEQELHLSETLTSRLLDLSQDLNVTINTLFQGAWAILLSRYSGEEDVVFGAVRAGRRGTIAGSDGVVGPFINTLPVRTQIRESQTAAQMLSALRKQHIAVRPHEHTPLMQVIRWSEMPSETRLFDSFLVFNNTHLIDRLRSTAPSWKKRDIYILEQTEFPITLYGHGGRRMSLKLAFQREQYDDGMVHRMLRSLSSILQGMLENVHRPVSRIPCLDEDQAHQVVVSWNETSVDYPQDACLHQLFEAQVERSPNAIAVIFEDQTLTYQVLNQRANQLGHRLMKLGVGPDVPVGVFMGRSLELVIALYAILKAGGAYLPLDPEFPQERIKYMLEDARVPVLLTQSKLVAKLPEHNAQVQCLEPDWNVLAGEATSSPQTSVAAENLAYVIFTSGSTGRPKGVMNHHRGICNRLLWMQDEYKLAGSDRIMQKTPFSFDVSVWEFFWPLIVGARLVVARPGGHKDPSYMIDLISRQQITTMHFVPSMLQIFLEAENVGSCQSLKRVICSGEALPYSLQERFFSLLDAELHNLYGPTEAAVDVSYWKCRPDSELQVVPIGRPVANTQLYILDRHMQPVPIGVPGELHIGGAQVARGYVNRPDLTAERFVPDPFSSDPDARLYKTGDRVRFLADGNIQFLGRLDFQVKIRGNRIELGEIEAVLGQDPSVRETVVLCREDTPGDQRIVAYYVPQLEMHPQIDGLRAHLENKLPDFMMPSAFVEMDALPLTPNGKVNRKGLPAPSGQRSTAKTFIRPQKEVEIAIAAVWQELLKIERVGVDDNFFDLGGHSLLLLRAHQKLAHTLNRDLSVTDLFRFPTIRSLSEHLSADTRPSGHPSAQSSADRGKARRIALQRRRKGKDLSER